MADVSARRWHGPLRDGRNYVWVDGDAALRDEVAEEADRGADELALGGLGLGKELVVAQRLEHLPHVHEVLLAHLGEDEDVVVVDLDEVTEHRRGRTCRGGSSRGSAAGGVKTRAGRPKMECMYVI